MSDQTADEFDVIVVGSGPGGYVAAVRSAQLGMRTAVVERAGTVGGRCLNLACIPAKVVLRSADILAEAKASATFGVSAWDREPTIDFASVAKRRRDSITSLTQGVSGLLRKGRVELLEGTASLATDGAVVVADSSYRAIKGVILATGSRPRELAGLPFGGNVVGTEEAWALDELPDSLAVVGAGASGAEIASAYARLGKRVTLFEMGDRVLPIEDADVSKIVEREFKRQDIDVRTSTAFDGDESDLIVVAAGRVPDIEALHLDGSGVELDAEGFVKVDRTMRTTVAGIYAIGDLVTGPSLAHKASDEAIVAAEAIAGLEPQAVPYENVPRATFCAPNVGSFGLTEDQARQAGFDVTIGKVQYASVGASTVYGERIGLIKLVGDRTDGEILGAHVVGARATDLIQEVLTAKLLDGGYPEIARAIHSHPTLSEGVMEAARAADGWVIHG